MKFASVTSNAMLHWGQSSELNSHLFKTPNNKYMKIKPQCTLAGIYLLSDYTQLISKL